jgi:SPP1 gp7 family putative phage head morphogenesis protein
MKKDQSENRFFIEQLKAKRRAMKPWQRKRTQSPPRTTAWLYPFTTERQYTKYLFNLMDIYSDIAIPFIRENIKRWTGEQKIDGFKTDQFSQDLEQLNNELEETEFNMFDNRGEGVSDEKGNFFNRSTILFTLLAYARSIDAFNQKQWGKFTKAILGDPFTPFEPWLDEVINAWKEENFRLIRKLSTEYITEVNRIVSSGVMDGKTWDAIMRDIRKKDKNLTRSRARLLARDQVGKLNGRLTKRRQQEIGVNWYIWRTAQDERVRDSHRVLNNKICKWDDDTVYADSIEDAKNGNWKQRSSIKAYIGMPQQDIQCRCVSLPVMNDLVGLADEEIEEESNGT